jgi:hypothetical protein
MRSPSASADRRSEDVRVPPIVVSELEFRDVDCAVARKDRDERL